MLKIEVILGENDVMGISEGLKKVGIGRPDSLQGKGQGKKTWSRNSCIQGQ